MKLIEGEIILKSIDDKIILTNYRLRKTEGKDFISIVLKNISSIEKKHTQKSILYIFTPIIVTYFSVLFIGNMGIPIGLFSLYFVYLFFISKKEIVTVSSKGGEKLIFETKKINTKPLFELLHLIEKKIIETEKKPI